MDDPFIRGYIDDVLRSLRTQWILEIIKPYTRLEIAYLARVSLVSDCPDPLSSAITHATAPSPPRAATRRPGRTSRGDCRRAHPGRKDLGSDRPSHWPSRARPPVRSSIPAPRAMQVRVSVAHAPRPFCKLAAPPSKLVGTKPSIAGLRSSTRCTRSCSRNPPKSDPIADSARAPALVVADPEEEEGSVEPASLGRDRVAVGVDLVREGEAGNCSRRLERRRPVCAFGFLFSHTLVVCTFWFPRAPLHLHSIRTRALFCKCRYPHTFLFIRLRSKRCRKSYDGARVCAS